MEKKKIGFISNKMKELDICMLSTTGGRGAVSTRPMSNNRQVKYNGESFFFTDKNTQKVRDVTKNSSVSLSFTGKKGLYIIVKGKARIIKSKELMEEHWVPSLEQWFKDGIDTKGLVMLAVKAQSIHYWVNYKEGEISL
jgi:general stress protein 26